jgi:hypothetical protein
VPWFKVDDKLHDHRKARAAGATAMGLWVLAGSWSADNLTDGFIPATILPRWGRPRDANRLTEVGLWHTDEQDGETGWRFHEWAERQPLRAQKLAERAVRAEAGRVGGLHSGRSRREAKPKQVASPLLEPPSRPDPTRPEEHKTRKRPSIPQPDDWQPTEAHLERRHDGIDVQREVETFKAHAESVDRRCVNWNAAFTQWLIKARPAPRTAGPGMGQHKGRAAQWLDLARQLQDEEQAALEIQP